MNQIQRHHKLLRSHIVDPHTLQVGAACFLQLTHGFDIHPKDIHYQHLLLKHASEQHWLALFVQHLYSHKSSRIILHLHLSRTHPNTIQSPAPAIFSQSRHRLKPSCSPNQQAASVASLASRKDLRPHGVISTLSMQGRDTEENMLSEKEDLWTQKGRPPTEILGPSNAWLAGHSALKPLKPRLRVRCALPMRRYMCRTPMRSADLGVNDSANRRDFVALRRVLQIL